MGGYDKFSINLGEGYKNVLRTLGGGMLVYETF